MTSHKGYNEPGPVYYLIGPSCTRLALVVVPRSPFPVPPLQRSFPLFLRSPRHPSSLVLFSPDAGPSYRSRRLLFSTLCASSPSIQTPGPGTVEIIKRRPAFGATSGIRVGALYSRHYPPRKLGRDETAFLSPSSSHRLRLCTVLPSPVSLPLAVLPATRAGSSPTLSSFLFPRDSFLLCPSSSSIFSF